MASQPNGGQTVHGNLQIFGDADCNGTLNVDETITTPSATLSQFLSLTPTASPPASAEGRIYAGTDHKLYFHNGTAWKEIAFV